MTRLEIPSYFEIIFYKLRELDGRGRFFTRYLSSLEGELYMKKVQENTQI